MRVSLRLLKLTGTFAEKFVKYGAYSPIPLSLKKLTAFAQGGCAVKSATFLRDELPVRLANIMQEIQLLPDQLIQTPSASLVNHWYEQSFCELMEFESAAFDEKLLTNFNERLAQIRNRHTTTVETMAQGVMEMQERHKTDLITNNQVQYFLDRFYMMRISIRMLINHHLLMFGSELNKHRRFAGSIDPDCNVLEILEDAYEDAKFLCEHYYSTAPTITVDTVGADKGKIEFVYVPSHLYHILFELLKNAMRAVVEQKSRDTSLPPIEVLVAAGKESVTIKISDLGGGIPRSDMEFVFNYTYTTARGGDKNKPPEPIGESGNAPLAGYGYGLPLSRLYAKYFNGDLILASVEGYGTDAIVYLKRNAADADELLPVFNRTSARQYGTAGIPVADWSNPQFTTGWRRT
ncbi:Pyruvate dehydrogenase lipoamide kinase [Fasciola gigantica]|uniref:Protein-serine/threonine kinase n=1 Tax=Fasciola gigantica TaxID=46835 RepID=A0A504YAN0_FASGI|nr:Pyruvate dehydrogenase lipoamide kinase [Fasciola gigantica]